MLWFSDVALVLTQINMFLQKHKLKTTEREQLSGETRGDAHLGRRD